jgi:putative glutamine amidotransferase
MRRTLILALISFCYLSLEAQDTLLLFNPTAYNLALIESLMDKGLLNLDGYHVLGVYHSREQSDYKPALEKASENPNGIFTLTEITEELQPDILFKINPCTPRFEELFRKSEGALFLGGPDIPPGLYNEPVHLLTSVTDPFRHYLESSFIFHLLGGNQDPGWVPWLKSKNHFLVSGICLGMQTMNVATGGTLIQDIPTEVYRVWSAEEILEMPSDQAHRNYLGMVESQSQEPTSYHFHKISLTNGSFLSKDLKLDPQTTPLVLSSHHQAIEEPGRGWKISATSMDGKIIEAIEHVQFPHVFGVQFHPEKPGLFDPTINFQEVIKDSDSFTFHTAYWNYLGRILQERSID